MTIPDPPRATPTKCILWVVATVAAPLAAYAVLSSVYIGAWYALSRHQGPPPSWLLMQAMFIGLPVAEWMVVALWWWVHARRMAVLEFFNARPRALVSDTLVGLALGAVWVAMYGAGGSPPFARMVVMDRAKLASIPLSVSAGVCEELLFRGFVILMIARAGGGAWSKLIWSSVAFSLAHCFWGPAGMFWTLVLGLTLGAVTWWRGSIWPAIVGHTLLDLCIEPGLLLLAFNGQRGR